MLPTWLRALARALRARPSTRINRKPPRTQPGLESLEDRRLLATFTVINTLDDNNLGSLRRAINDANGSSGVDLIAFNIPGSGTHTIATTSQLPAVTEAVTIDGTTQP